MRSSGNLRPPYCGGPDTVTATDWRAYQRAASFGYLITLDSLDTRDWAKPGVTLLSVDEEGFVLDQRDYWNDVDGRREPYPGW